MAITADET